MDHALGVHHHIDHLRGHINNQQASINSSPLFIKVAESTEIFGPISQLGCFTAWAGVTAASSAALNSRNGPPEAVSSSLSTPALTLPEGTENRIVLGIQWHSVAQTLHRVHKQ